MNCTTCNSTLPEDSLFCLACGSIQEAVHDAIVGSFIQVLLKDGTTAYEDNRYEEAIAAFNKILDINPEHAEAAKNLSMVEDEYKAIQDTLEQARLLIAQRKFEEAQNQAWKILEVIPHLREAENVIAQASTSIRRFDEALKQGKEFYEENRWEDALDKFRLALDINPYAKDVFPLKQEAQRCFEAWEQEVERIEKLREAHSFKEAITFAEEMAERRPFDAKLLGFLNDTRKTLETLEEGRSAGEKALKAERWTEAKRAWERVLSILPEDAVARQKHSKAAEEEAKARAARMRTMVKLGVLAAVGLTILAVAVVGYSNRRCVEWGRDYLQSGHPDKALEEFEKAGTFLVDADELALLKREALYGIHMQNGNAARTNKEWDKAKAAYREAAHLSPGTGEAKVLIAMVEAFETMEAARKLGKEMNYAEAIKSAREIANMNALPDEPSDFAFIRDEAHKAIGEFKSSWLATARKFLDSQQYLASSVRLRKILAEFPEDEETLKLLTRCCNEWLTHAAAMRNEGKWDDALLECQRMSVAFPEDRRVKREVDTTKSERCLQEARLQFEQKKYHEALSTISQAEEWMRGIPEVFEKGKALSTAINAVIDEKYSEHMVVAKESAKKKKFEEAKEALQQAMRYRKTREAESLLKEMTDRLATPAGMVYIPASDSIVGDSTQKIWKREGPTHKVKLPAFYIDIVPVTNAEYMKFVKATGHRMPAHWANAGKKIPEGEESHPVTYVNITDAEAYAKWAKKRLPTEAEWEKVARGPDGLKYPWGNTYKTGAANDENAGRKGTSPVGEYPAGKSPFGCLDMAGNVWEWTKTRFHLYPGSTEKLSEEEKQSFVAKGGCFMDDKLFLRSSFRELVEPTSAYATRATLGFRCAADVKR